MVTMNHLSMEDSGDDSPLLPEAVGVTTPTSLFPRQPITKADSWDFFLSRSQNSALAASLLFGCFSAVLLPAYLPPEREPPPGVNDEHNILVHSRIQQGREDFPLSLPSPPQARLNRSSSLLAGPCRPRWCLTHLKPLASSDDLLDVPVFLQREGPRSQDLSPPLGLQGSEEHLALALASLPQRGPPPALSRGGGCRRCVVVGNGGVLHGSRLGAHIDQHDVVIRMNNAPVVGFERDAGSRTTVRLTYPEGAPHSPGEYHETAVVALAVFKSLDLAWLTSVVTKQPLGFWSRVWFWREVVDEIPLKAESFRILHPEVIRRTGQVLLRYAATQGKMVPTLGASAVVMALQVCDQVSLAGFGYDMQRPRSRLHYYESVPMGAMAAQVVHDISAEKLFLRDLVSAGAVVDLTGAL